MTTEIERKFVLDSVPTQVAEGTVPGDRLRQGYLAQEGEVEVRVRMAGAGATLTVKGGKGLSRTEVELPLTAEQAEALWAHTEGRRLEKARHRLDVGGVVAEVDVYGGALDGLVVGEVEFTSEGDAGAFEPPPGWRDVTGRPGWGNADLARHGAPAADA